MTPLFEFREAGVRYESAEALCSVSLKLYPGEFAAIAGPNGSGKSTLLSVAAGLLRPSAGQCLFDGKEAHRWDRRTFAQRVAVVLQTGPTAFPFTVEQVVAMGRMPKSSGLFETANDRAAVNRALSATGIEQLRTRDFRTLSGGERQRALLSAALAQEPDVLLLDEPSTHLDLQHQISLHALLRDLSRKGLLIVSVTHDLNLASFYADRLILMNRGRICADGPAARVMNPAIVREVFGVRVEVHTRPSGAAWLVYGE